MLRTIIIILLTGHGLSWWHDCHPTDGKPLSGVVCVLDVPREVLDERIRRRVHDMVAGGLRDEVAGLLRAGYTRDDPGLNGVGYREMADHLAGRITLEEAMERTRVATRRYAKRQVTWFRHQLGPDAVSVDGTASLAGQQAAVVSAWRARRGGSRAGASRAGASRAGAEALQ